MTRISVIVPSYNHADYIEACLGSVLAHRDPTLELIVVDDGSSDDSLERLNSLRGDPRLKIYPQNNQGAHAALNRGLELSHGELIFILNSDDAFAPERIPHFVERFKAEPDLILLCSWLHIVDEQDKVLGVKEGYRNLPPWPQPRPGPSLSQTGDLQLALLETNFIATTSNIAFRRSLIAKHQLRFTTLRYTHDWDFILAAGQFGAYSLIEEPLARYRVHATNTIREGQDELGMGTMRFEILWTVARHAARVLGRFETPPHDLQARAWRSLPHFGCETILNQLLLMRGDDLQPPAAYDRLLDKDHPFRQRAIAVLATAAD